MFNSIEFKIADNMPLFSSIGLVSGKGTMQPEKKPKTRKMAAYHYLLSYALCLVSRTIKQDMRFSGEDAP